MGGGLADEETVLELRDAIVEAVRSGRLPEERLAEAAARVRSLGSWARLSSHRLAAQGGLYEPDLSIGLRAARRALRVTVAEGQPFRPVTDRPFVASFSPQANIAVGDETPWGVAGMLAERFPAPGPRASVLRPPSPGSWTRPSSGCWPVRRAAAWSWWCATCTGTTGWRPPCARS